ncbi:hypothetical protein GCM10007304_22430 [Rhodococcoides trifolii]|uniref:Uncharacterized protein n=1 Tax=Rhodococcoides trifolii TaxID=908250 RepID=A0A917D3Z4_9NOCA|nr:hypothetical protein [Rhodococcus trifolii]GGG07887.1 hypothetical protein GCM10007304_22430 [Rhodococcus trifolii]
MSCPATVCVTATIEDNDYRAARMAALNADHTMLVRLEAEPDTLQRRIRDREPASWSGLDDLVRNARTLADTMVLLTRVDLVISTEGREVDDVASELLSALRVG